MNHANHAKLKFFYSVMNSGKSTRLLQENHIYKSEGNNTLILTSSKDHRFGKSIITSRLNIYIQAPCTSICHSDNILDIFKQELNKQGKISCVLIDEAQFFTEQQVIQMSDIVDYFHVPVLAYGLKNNYMNGIFEGSKALWGWADELINITRPCHCGCDAAMILRYDQSGNVFRDGNEVIIGSEDKYQSVCRRHWKQGNLGPKIYEKLEIDDPFKLDNIE